jgi:predicted permease
MIDALRNLRASARSLGRSPAMATAIVLSLGLGIGANTLVFSWLESTVLNPYPMVRESDRLVALNVRAPDGRDWPLSYPTLREWQNTGEFDGIAGWTAARLTRRGTQGAPAADVWAMLVSANYFDVLGLDAVTGRMFTLEEEERALPVAVLAHAYWMRAFGGDRAVVGRELDLNGIEVSVIGVAPPGFVGTYTGAGFDLWVPLTLRPLLLGEDGLRDRSARWLQSFARLQRGSSLEAARAELNSTARAASESAGDVPVTGALVRRMREQFLGSLVFPLFNAMLGVTGVVLLIASANVANLLLARSTSRRREMAVRIALGAGQGRLVLQTLGECMLLAVPGMALGVALAWGGRGLLQGFVPPVPLRVELPIAINLRVLAFAAIITSVATVSFGVLPAMRRARVDPAGTLRASAGAGSSRSRLRAALVVSQIALSLVALVTAGLFVRSLAAARRMDLGFIEPGQVLLVGTDLTVAELDPMTGAVTRERLLEEIRAIPGVRVASASTMVPLGFGGHRYADVQLEGRAPAADENVSAERVVVATHYFETMGTALVRGRSFNAEDRAEGRRVAIVNESFVRRFWPGIDPIGRTVDQGRGPAEIVGVARDGKYRDLDDVEYPVVWWPLEQVYEPRFTIHVRTEGDPARIWGGVRSAFAVIDSRLPFLTPRTLDEHIRASTLVRVIGASMLGAFGVLALVMAMVGLGASLSQVVRARRRELGVRIALGADARSVVGLVVTDALRLAAIGLAVGAPLAIATSVMLRSRVVGVGTLDPLTFALVTLLIVFVCMVATAGPAVRAARTDPMRILRIE